MPPARQPDQSAPRTVSPTGVGYEGPKDGRDPRGQAGDTLTTPNGVRIPDSDHSLKAGPRGPVLLEDFHLREKIMHFDHERIPERVVHARGAGAHGVFTANGAAAKVTRAAVLAEKGLQTPVFVRFSTVLGSRGSADTVRDTRGFATKFYTKEGTWDLVGNNIPVFFIQDAIKFPDIVHAAKPHPDREIPQAQSAHDTFWDFVTLHTEATHHTIWNMSDRGIPRSYRTMEGFGVHTFRLVDAKQKTVAGQVPLEAPAGRALPDLGRGADRRGRRPGLPPPRPLRRHRERRLPRVGPRHPGLPGHPGRDLRGHRPARPDQDRAGGAGAGADHRHARPEREPDQLLRRDRAGRLPHRAPRAGHRGHQRPPAAGPQLLLPRHAAHPARRAELHPDPDQPTARAGQRQHPGRVPPAGGAHRAGAVHAQQRRRRRPVPGDLGRRGPT